MVFAFRLVKKKWASSAFDGEGAKQFGGRFNSKGNACVYLASSESLAILEVMVHLEENSLLQHYMLYRLAIPAQSILQLNVEKLPGSWREDPAPSQTAAIGDEWLKANASLALAVPSAIVPREENYLINPSHADFQALVQTAEPLTFQADRRLLK
ncbi:RES domain-containing protein [Alcaligenaceae bacterium]|nr:RES domain-containing protein [Alcaligenaceae bacterium]